MALANMSDFTDYVINATIETVNQNVNAFNEASRGAIILNTDGFDGGVLQEAMFASLHDSQRRVDRNSTNADVASTPLSQIEQNIVKVAGGFGPVVWEPSQMNWINENETMAIEAISRNLSEAIMKDQLNTSIAASIAAVENVASLVNDVSATLGVSYSALNGADAKFGDNSGSLVCQVMNSSTYHKLIDANLSNSNNLFSVGNITVVGLTNKVVVVVDAPALYVAGTPNKGKVLTLVTAGVVLSNSGDLVLNIERSNGKERIETTYQVDYTFDLGIKGFSWDTVNGGTSPSDAELATGTNWDLAVSSVKSACGVLTVFDADK